MAGRCRSRLLRRAVATPVVLASLVAAASASAAFTPGAPGVGDAFFPRAGNGGYDVSHYDLDLTYRLGPGKLDATARIRATATQDLSAFDLDYRGPGIISLRVDGEPASFRRDGQELVVTPAAGIPAGQQFTVAVAYRGRPHAIIDPDGSKEGWLHTDDGAFVVGEPQGSPTWFPCNDHPTDKATFEIAITVPRRTEAVSNGALVLSKRTGRFATWRYVGGEPMATYLATATIGQFEIDRSPVGGLDSLVAVDPREGPHPRKLRRTTTKIGEITEFFETLFGPYPFGETGAIIDRADAGYALETQTRPIYDGTPNEATVAHEIAHQWFGNSVSLSRWEDMWLNEGFATWVQWRWQEESGGQTTAERFRDLENQPPSNSGLWEPPPAAIPDPSQLFATSVYVRGAMALEALRQEVGDAAFYATLRAWAATHAYSNATTPGFITLAEAQSGEQLDALFYRYLYKPGKP